MGATHISRGMGFASAAMAWLAAGGFAQNANAQDWHSDYYGYCWIDVATREVQPFGPPGGGGVGKKKTSYEGHNYALVPCPAVPATTGWHPFFAVEAGGGWSNSNFDVMPNFGVGGSGFAGDINGGALFDIPGTKASIGGRVGWEGGNLIGTVSAPAASPLFDYTVKTRSTFYEEAMVEVRGWQIPTKAQMDMWASVGVAEVERAFTATSGAFRVTDSTNQTGFTGALGVGVPISSSFLAGKVEVELYAQYRVIVLPGTSVNIPGRVQIDDQWTQSVKLGLLFRSF